MTVHRGGWRIILAVWVACSLLVWLILHFISCLYVSIPLVAVLIFFMGFVLYFFRIPSRTLPEGDGLVTAVADGEIVIAHKDGRRETVAADSIITCIGYVPTPLEKGSHRIHLVGDCKHVGNLRTVIWGAYDVAMRI